MKQLNNKKDENSDYMICQEYYQKPSVDKFIYLYKTGFRGFYSVNQKNEFNVAYGHDKTPLISDEENILSMSQ